MAAAATAAPTPKAPVGKEGWVLLDFSSTVFEKYEKGSAQAAPHGKDRKKQRVVKAHSAHLLETYKTCRCVLLIILSISLILSFCILLFLVRLPSVLADQARACADSRSGAGFAGRISATKSV
eukprot:3140229-Rhodomonas_salina.1